MTTRNYQPSKIRKSQILDAALHMIGENGTEGLTTAKIAKKVGIAESTVFKHFTSKTEILQTLTSVFTRQLLDLVTNIQVENIDAKSKLTKLFVIHLTMLKKNQGIPRIVFGGSLQGEDLIIKETIQNTITRYIGIVEDIIKQGINDGSFKKNLQPKFTAHLFLAIIQQTVLDQIITGESLDPDNIELIDFYINLIS